jgi:hypothetical protein
MNSCARRTRRGCSHMAQVHDGVVTVDYYIDLDPTHSVVRLTVTARIVTLRTAEDCYRALARLAGGGGPYAAIYDLSRAIGTTLPTNLVRYYARRTPAIPMGRPHVVVGKEPHIYGLARVFQMCREFIGEQFDVVRSLEEAYDLVGARPEDFTERVVPAGLAA